jgi:hypothetical protein
MQYRRVLRRRSTERGAALQRIGFTAGSGIQFGTRAMSDTAPLTESFNAFTQREDRGSSPLSERPVRLGGDAGGSTEPKLDMGRHALDSWGSDDTTPETAHARRVRSQIRTQPGPPRRSAREEA